MSLIRKHIDKDNLHHAYLIEGDRSQIEAEIIELMQDLNIATLGNPDFSHISLDSFKIDDARNLKSLSVERGFSSGKRVFLISANNFLLEAQNTLLKMFEEPIENTHFFLIMPDSNILLKTFLSRFYLISLKQNNKIDLNRVEKFISMSLPLRLNFIKELLADAKEEDVPTKVGIPTEVGKESARSESIRFLNQLEQIFQNKLQENSSERNNFTPDCFEHFFKVRKYLNQPGSSIKSLMESIAIIVPNI